MDADLSKLKIDQDKKSSNRPSPWATKWIVGVIALFLLLGAANVVYSRLNAATDVDVMRVKAESVSGPAQGTVILNATGYIIAAHKIELASKVIGRVAWIGVEKGDRVKKDEAIVRLEDDEYRAQLQQATGRLENLQAHLAELLNGSRPEEIAVAKANLEQAQADLVNAKVNLARVRKLVTDGVFAPQQLDDAQAQYDSGQARVNSLAKTYELVKIGPRQEEIAAMRGQITEARGAVAFAETQLKNTVIRAPLDGTILERNVEIGEFVTTGFVGDRGAKGYVVSMANMKDLQVELDISQNDFARLSPRQPGVVTTDAYPDRKYDGFIEEISPEANRQKATVQVKVRIQNPDEYLRPEMNASVAFLAKPGSSAGASSSPESRLIYIPASAVRNGSVFLVLDGKAVSRQVKVSGTTTRGLRIEQGLIGGEDLIVNPPDALKDGDRVRQKQG
jgi:HlyD family secretion protein